MEIRGAIREFITSTFYPPEDLDDHTSLMGTGTMDSTGMLETIAFLEERFGIVVADADVLPDNFDTVAKQVAYVSRKLDEPSRSPPHEDARPG